jgi:hypothetical protein
MKERKDMGHKKHIYKLKMSFTEVLAVHSSLITPDTNKVSKQLRKQYLQQVKKSVKDKMK